MKQTIKSVLALILALLLLFPAAVQGEDGLLIEEETEQAGGEITEKDGWYFDARGFLAGDDNPGEAYLFEDEENGLWQYASRTLSIRVERTREKPKKGSKKIREYCVAEIWASPESPLGVILSDPTGTKNPVPGKHQEKPETLLRKQPSVLAVSDDMYGLRIQPSRSNPKKTRYDYHGVVIRNSEILCTKTRVSPEEGKKDKRPWPNLDTLAVYEDGSMKAFLCDEQTPEQYLEQGAQQVFAFGPWLLRDGVLNPALENPKYYPASEPRAAIGMIEPWHYVIIATGGRPDSKYAGVKLLWLAEKMQEMGCTEALNLDGGETVIMAFNNKVILQGDARQQRNLGSLIAFGLEEAPASDSE